MDCFSDDWPILQSAEGILDAVSLPVKALVVSGRFLARLPGWDAGADATVPEAIVQPVGVLRLVAPETLAGRQMAQQHECATTIGHLTWGEEEVQRPALTVAEHVQLGVQAAFRASDRPRTIPFFRRLAAVPCAFRDVLSIINVSP